MWYESAGDLSVFGMFELNIANSLVSSGCISIRFEHNRSDYYFNVLLLFRTGTSMPILHLIRCVRPTFRANQTASSSLSISLE